MNDPRTGRIFRSQITILLPITLYVTPNYLKYQKDLGFPWEKGRLESHLQAGEFGYAWKIEEIKKRSWKNVMVLSDS